MNGSREGLTAQQTMKRYLTTGDVAELLRTTPETVRYWRHIKSGPASFKIGRRVLYDPDVVQAFIDAAQAAGAA